MTKGATKKIEPVQKPFLRGHVKDERTWKNAVVFFGLILLASVMCFLVCSMTGLDHVVLRVLLNTVIEALVLMIFYSRGTALGTDDVARGEVLYQRQERGMETAASERAMCYHPAKGFVIGLLGTAVLFLAALVFALKTEPQALGAGVLPGWLQPYLGRDEIGGPLAYYTQTEGLQWMDMLRILIRTCVIPFVSMVGTANRTGVVTVERLSPVLILLPAIAYGLGYLRGPGVRSRVHTEIAENKKRRARREKRERRARMKRSAPKGPEQLN